MATRKPARKPAPKKITPKPLPAMPEKKGTCGVDGYCCQGKSAEDCCGGNCGGGCGCGKKSWCHIMPMFGKKRFWVGVILAVATIMAFDWVWHGRVLMERYLETSFLWRPEAEMVTLTQWFAVAQVLYALAFTVLYTLMDAKSYLQGIKNGFLIASPLAIMQIYNYVTQPIPTDILQMWAAGFLIQGALLGLILTAVGHYACHYSSKCGGGSCEK